MARNQIGVAWHRTFDGGAREFIGGVLEFGALGEVPFAVFPNKYHDPQRRRPTHNIVVTLPPAGGIASACQRVQVGAGWERPGREAGQTYISFTLELDKLGAGLLPAVDFAKQAEPVYGRLVANRRAGSQGPHYLLLRAQRWAEDRGDAHEEGEHVVPVSVEDEDYDAVEL